MAKKQGVITYKSIGKDSKFIKELLKAIPPQFIPTSKTGWIAMGLMLFFIVYGIVQSLLPIMDISFDITQGEALELSVEVGWPMVFFGTSDNGTRIEVSVWAAIVDVLIYLIIGYIIDIIINYVISFMPTESRKEKLKRKPKVFKFQKAKDDASSKPAVKGPAVTPAQAQNMQKRQAQIAQNKAQAQQKPQPKQ